MMPESEPADDLWYAPNQVSSLGRAPGPVLYANDPYLNNPNIHNVRALPSDSIHIQSSLDLASIIADRQRDVLQRMANKAERARRSRRKRKAYLSDLETQSQQLANQLRSLSAQELQLNQRAAELSQENRLITKHMETEHRIEGSLDALRLKQQELLATIQSTINAMKDEGSVEPLSGLIEELMQNCRSIGASFDAYLKLAQSTISFGRGHPSEALWILLSSNDHVQELHSVLELTEEQLQQLDSFRKTFNILKLELVSASKLLDGYRLHCEGLLNTRDREIRSILTIMGPANCSKILSFVENQTWCMELLNSLFPQYIASSLDQQIASF